MAPILPGATIGFLGGGQLGRMTAMAARSLGYGVRVLDPDPKPAAGAVADATISAAFDDAAAAEVLARDCAVITLEIEKIGIAALDAAGRYAPVRPGADVLHIVQDRGRQKEWLVKHGFPVGPHAIADDEQQFVEAVRRMGASFAKVCHGGYDGRGQMRIASADDAGAAWSSLGASRTVVERGLDLAAELSVLVARRPSGEVVAYPPALNHHEEQILSWSVLPAPLPEHVLSRAREIALGIATELRVEGLLVTEMFLLEDDTLLVNELAPRPHNSYHASEAACRTSQFEQAVRAVCDLPLGAPDIVQPAAIVNLFGDLWLDGGEPAFDRALALRGVQLHLYGKRGARRARKMGHLTATAATPEAAVALAQAARAALD
jgi:5-(carboxyamino)imidazole ribonucleotide synthase